MSFMMALALPGLKRLETFDLYQLIEVLLPSSALSLFPPRLFATRESFSGPIFPCRDYIFRLASTLSVSELCNRRAPGSPNPDPSAAVRYSCCLLA